MRRAVARMLVSRRCLRLTRSVSCFYAAHYHTYYAQAAIHMMWKATIILYLYTLKWLNQIPAIKANVTLYYIT